MVRAFTRKDILCGAILHSNCCSQYTNDIFKNTLSSYGLSQSFSGVHHCYDNARMESFFATLKEFIVQFANVKQFFP